jgi:crotonobetainyl-CoA:carnitine CoA-transferase CaiB-like acyl-CoA transferase
VPAPEADAPGGSASPPLSGFRVVDLSTWIGGAYCTKLLADGGAEVIKVEAPEGDPLRRWSASGSAIPVDGDSALFNFLGASKRSVVVDGADPDGLRDVHALLDSADAVVWSDAATWTQAAGLGPREVVRAHPHLVVTSITPFGLDGPWSGKPATEFTLQAWSGGIVGLARGRPERPPVFVGGQIGEWLAGLYGAIGTLAARRRAGAGGELVDVSMLEALAMCLTYYPVTFNDQLGRPMRRKRFVATPGVGAARDGLVGLGCGTGQQWLDFCVLVGHPEWMEDRSLFLDRTALAPTIDAWIAEHTVEEVLAEASAFRIPNAPITNGANAATWAHFRARGTFVANPKDGVTNPGPPFRLGAVALRAPEAAPRLGELRRAEAATPAQPAQPAQAPPVTEPRTLPFEGLRILDMTSFWAGPLTGHMLALLGAEVIHLESATRPDGARLVGGVPPTEDRYWERGPIFAALNTNKKSLTINLSEARGLDLVRRVIGTCDVVVENYTPRVLDQLGLDFESLRAARPDLIMVRMPGFGLDGPGRDLSAFAFVIEDAAGLTWLTGHEDLLPFEPYCVGDPNAGLHALYGLQLALEHRERTGEGGLVEAAMVDAALNIAAEQPIEFSAYGALLERAGNRGPTAAPQNLYKVAGPDEHGRDDGWVAIAVASDAQWHALCGAMGDPAWAGDPELATASARRQAHDRIDAALGEWCRARSAEEIVTTLWEAGVPVAKVLQPHDQPDLPQLAARHFFEELDHPVIGPSRYSTLPMRFSHGPEPVHRRHAPLLGEHNGELLTALGLSPAEQASLEADGIIGGSLARAT